MVRFGSIVDFATGNCYTPRGIGRAVGLSSF
jgi:hypothetical protein